MCLFVEYKPCRDARDAELLELLSERSGHVNTVCGAHALVNRDVGAAWPQGACYLAACRGGGEMQAPAGC